ncbi:MAG TPA: Calx-beta domain-containing protein [Actinophytocola sp.]|uniref:Calx-beta domain-containing protein n=1 Tax=Actinophytocola sp. TaxID=1872138 RepID=UPI002DDCE8B4|nr:Calx-beta domain-containing protein [Actinophytocola sp.]HEV2778292.1 Calx-beta domain-containing protein [Actinophytocola sp.]
MLSNAHAPRSRLFRLRALGAAAVVVAATAGLGAAAAPLAAPGGGVDPGTVELTLGPGQSATVAKRVTTPAVAPKPDIVFLGDTTGSMDPVLANVRNNTRTIIDRIRESQPDARFAVTAYKDQLDGPKAFTVNTPLTDDADAVQAGTNQWLFDVGGGGAPWTDFINAHYRIATDAIAFRPDSTRIIAWFGDAASRDPSLGHTLADASNALRGAGAHVIAVPIVGTSGDGLDRLGQASSITNATRGRLMPDTAAEQVSDAILAGIQILEVTVTPRVTACDSALEVSLDPTVRTVRSGTDANFTETFRVRPDAAAGTYHCTVDFLVNGVSQGLVQQSTVHVPGVSIGDVTVTEGDSGTTSATFNITLDRPAATEVRVRWATSDGTATAPDDFLAGSGEAIFPFGTTTQPVTVPIVGDLAAEPVESFPVTLSAPQGAAIADGAGVGTIVDDDTDPIPSRLSISDTTVTEGNAGTTRATFTLGLDRASTGPVTVHWATANGTATAPEDFTAASGDERFEPGQLTRQVTVDVRGDTADEDDESFTVQLTNVVGAEPADAQGVGLIVDDDGAPGARLSIGDVSVIEGDSGTTEATFTVTRAGAATGPITVDYATADGTAAAPGDYTAVAGRLDFAPDQTSRPVVVPIVGDTLAEGDESFTVRLTNAVGAEIADGQGVGVILDDGDPGDPDPQLSIGDTTVTEGDSGAMSATFTISLSRAPAAGEVSVRWATGDGTATAPADYAAGTGVETFAAGQLSRQVTVPVVGDTAVEGDETFTVTLSDAAGAEIADGQGVGTIVDDDAELPGLSIGDVSVTEGDTGTTRATFTVTLDRPGTGEVGVRFATADGTAIAPGDYLAATGEVRFPAGVTSRPVTVDVVGDLVHEPTETFAVILSDAAGAEIADGQGLGTIVDDDPVRAGQLTCTATALNLVDSTANPPNLPCRDDARSATLVRANLGLLAIRGTGLTAATEQTPDDLTGAPAAGDNATARSGLTSVTITSLGLTIEIGMIGSTATAECVAGPAGLAPRLSGSSTIATLKINGVAVPVGSAPLRIPLVIGSLELNTTVTTPTSITQRAFALTTVLGGVIIGEARAGLRGNPCGS